MKDYNGAGEDVTTPDISGRTELSLSLLQTDTGWKVDSEWTVSRNECVV